MPARATVAPEGASRVRALVLLGGSVRPSALSRALVDRSLLDLPLTDGQSVLGRWAQEAASLGPDLGVGPIPTRVIIDRAAIAPVSVLASEMFSIERDPAEFRGTGGLLRDLGTGYGPDDLLLVANAAQVLMAPLKDLARGLLRADGDVRLVAHEDGEPSGLLLVRCAVLSHLNPVGFVDFKEQFLPRLSGYGLRVGLVMHAEATGRSIRTHEGYIEALRCFHRIQRGLPPEHDAFAERWESTYSIVESGARVDDSATLQDAVVLSGARVQARGVAVRSVLCAGATVGANESVVDTVLVGSRRGAAGAGVNGIGSAVGSTGVAP